MESLRSLLSNLSPIKDNVTFCWGRVSEGSGIYLCFCYYFEQTHFVMFRDLLVFLFVKLLAKEVAFIYVFVTILSKPSF